MWLLSLLFCSIILVGAQERFALNILHYNDFHARFVETNPRGGVCDPTDAPCVGGFARIATAVRQGLRREPSSLLLNGGDSFQGTIWYNILRYNVTMEFMNMLPHDAHVLGNHEFDNGIEGVVPYLKGLNSTVVTANIIDDEEPSMHGLYEKSTIVHRDGRRIGIIGVIISSTNTLASTGKLRFTNEVVTVRQEAEKLNAQGVDIIIVLSHCGLDIDREIALNGGPYIDIIVGGHSHTLLYNGDVPEDSGFIPLGPYPVVVNQGQSGRPVLIVQAGAHTAYLGEIKVFFDSAGNLVQWHGNPHYMANEVEQDPEVLEKINEYLPTIQELANIEVGNSLVYLTSSCACGECNLGNLICDAFVDSVLGMAQGRDWHYAHFCVINQGGIRTDINPGVITYEDVILSTPFENRVEVFELRGDHIMEMLEFSVANEPYAGARMLQTSGLLVRFDGSRPVKQRVLDVSIRCIECNPPQYLPLQPDLYYRIVSQSFVGEGGDGFTLIRNFLAGLHAVFDGSRPVGNRVVDVTIRCIECDVPEYRELVPNKYYRVVSTHFIGQGGGDYTMLSENRRNVEIVGMDYEILMNYIRRQSPLIIGSEGRMILSNACLV